jgi:hypothetical protein
MITQDENISAASDPQAKESQRAPQSLKRIESAAYNEAVSHPDVANILFSLNRFTETYK